MSVAWCDRVTVEAPAIAEGRAGYSVGCGVLEHDCTFRETPSPPLYRPDEVILGYTSLLFLDLR